MYAFGLQIVGLFEILDAIHLATLVGAPRKSVDGIAIAQHFQRLAEQHQCLTLCVVDPSECRATHIDHEHDRDITLLVAVARVQVLAHFPAVRGIGIGLDDGIEIDVIAVRLAPL